MPSDELKRLADSGHLQRESPAREEVEGLLLSGSARPADALNEALSTHSRFDLAYNAAHALALAALRLRGYRSQKRYLVFQTLPHTLGIAAPTWRVLTKCHDHRNRTEYEGFGSIDETMLRSLLEAAREVHEAVMDLPRPPP